ncbi:hypothetical protein TraAM80_04444 [Trypanosoma rangeli]|uniref:Uncharacterized protein n=1 Tax=Trypanosoma rangeli TaxID=5698 RepID=A0A3R7L189_TRYRA|nr:uncharacterized protein TraAM80_04444 [Trypanosoma rangeli]RNF05522.1 hypothetical protein TraAM80_04444 [Trypanosoma rangeli]|eukprot:RNF05522.1 hypothetical protein TraAM80_04444 [Trypanosoma rangeli]
MPMLQYPFARWRLLNFRPSAEEWSECNLDNYQTTVLVFAIARFVVGGVVGLVVILCLIGKNLSDSCGGRKQYPNLWCPLRGYAANYTKEVLVRPVLLSVGVFLLLCDGLRVGVCFSALIALADEGN